MNSSVDAADDHDHLALTADIVAAYVSHNTVAVSELTGLITQVHAALLHVAGVQAEGAEAMKPAMAERPQAERPRSRARLVAFACLAPITVVAASVFVLNRHNVTADRKSTRLNSSHIPLSRMPSSA